MCIRDSISHDAELCLAFGAKVQLNARVDSIDELKAQGFTDVVVATGAWMPGSAGLGEGAELDVLEFLEAAKKGEDVYKRQGDGGAATAVVGLEAAHIAVGRAAAQHRAHDLAAVVGTLVACLLYTSRCV